MADLATVRKRLADYRGPDGGSRHPRYLFRGQSADHGSITPTFGRKLSEETEIGQAYTVCRYAKRICQGLRGYSIDYLDGVAILQHYGWPTPLIDLTGSLEVAVFFALLDAKPGSEAVVYMLDTEALPDQALVLDHGFLTHPLDDGAFGCRWLRQDGFAVTTKEWRDATEARAFDLLVAPFLAAIEAHKFTVAEGDRAEVNDVLSTSTDPVPAGLQSVLRLFCEEVFEGGLAPKLTKIIDQMWPPDETSLPDR